MTVSDVKWVDDDPRHEWGKFTGNVVNKPAVQQADGELYIEMSPHNNLFDARIDTTQRTHDFYLPVRCNVVRQAVLTIPAGYRVDTYLLQLPSILLRVRSPANLCRMGTLLLFVKRCK